MFEGAVAGILNRLLGKYVQDLDTENLNVGIFSGDFNLTDLKLKPEALVRWILWRFFTQIITNVNVWMSPPFLEVLRLKTLSFLLSIKIIIEIKNPFILGINKT